MRILKQVIRQLQCSTVEDSILALRELPPLPSTMPIIGDLQPRSILRVPIAPMAATKAALEEVEERLVLAMGNQKGVAASRCNKSGSWIKAFHEDSPRERECS